MKIHVKQSNGLDDQSDVLILTAFEGLTKPTGFLKEADDCVQNQISALIKRGVFSGKKDQILTVHGVYQKKSVSILVAGLGKASDLDYVRLRDVAGNVTRAAYKLYATSVSFLVDSDIWGKLEDGLKLGQSLSEGIVLGGYRYEDYKSPEEDEKIHPEIESWTFSLDTGKIKSEFTKGVDKGAILAESENIARNFANMPPNDLTPELYVEEIKSLFKKVSTVTVEVMDRKKAEKFGMGAFLGVAQGSVEEPYMVVLTYQAQKKSAPICYVGKGVTFDTGGISIKPAAKMKEMKGDMTGSATVLAALYAIARLQLRGHFVAIMPLVENMPSGSAQRPGDIVKAMNGKTIEIVNTDAEGRLILADALCYAVHLGASQIIDVATLTGACCVALGTAAAGILGNNEDMIQRFKDVSVFTGERVWQLPLYDDYLEQLKSDVADISHCYEGREAGTSTAAKFLEQFVDETPWVHLDIASVMTNDKTKGHRVKGMAAEGVRNLIEYACHPVAQ